MEVQFRIRGHYLLVEIDTDVARDLQYLRDKENNLGNEDISDETQMQEIVYDLLSQQFYHGSDVLTDRVGRQEYKIRGSDSIIQQVVEMMVYAGRFWMEGNYVDTLKEFADDLELDFPLLLSRFVDKLRSMEAGGDDMIRMMGGEVIFSMAVGEALMQFRTRIGDETRERLLKEAEVEGYVEKLGDETIEETVIAGLADKYSILLNLRVLRELARMSVKSVGERNFIRISKEMLSDIGVLEVPDHIIRRRERRKKRAEKRAREKISEETDDEIPPPIEEEIEDTDEIPELPDFSSGENNKFDFDLPDIPDA
jgi:hypothetical protein